MNSLNYVQTDNFVNVSEIGRNLTAFENLNFKEGYATIRINILIFRNINQISFIIIKISLNKEDNE